MSRKYSQIAIIVLCGLMMAAVVYAGPGKPNFGPSIYADGKVWGTKATTVLPAPNEHNHQSFDALYVITNSNNPDGQLPVAEGFAISHTLRKLLQERSQAATLRSCDSDHRAAPCAPSFECSPQMLRLRLPADEACIAGHQRLCRESAQQRLGQCRFRITLSLTRYASKA